MGPRNNGAREGDTRPFFLAPKYLQVPATRAIRDMKKISNKVHQGAVNIIMINLCPSLLSVETNDRQQFQCLNINLNNKNWNSTDAKTRDRSRLKFSFITPIHSLQK